MMKTVLKLIVNLLLASAFLAVAFLLVTQYSAESAFTAAEKYVKGYKWNEADAQYREAVSKSPFNAKYLAGYATFLTLQARYYAKGSLLGSAEHLYRKALELDPMDAGIYLSLGSIELKRRSFDKAFGYFRMAVENDPNGYDIACSVGLAGITAWKKLAGVDKALVIGRLKYAVQARPDKAEDLYMKAWTAQRDFRILQAMTPDTPEWQKSLHDFLGSHELWQFRREQAERIARYMPKDAKTFKANIITKVREWIEGSEKLGEANLWNQVDGKWQTAAGADELAERKKAIFERRKRGKVSTEDWVMVTDDGKGVKGSGGILYGKGTIYALTEVPDGKSVLKIMAKATAAARVWPYMIVEIDGLEIGETFVKSADMKEYTFDIDMPGGMRVIGVTFVNDRYDAGKKEDRNLFIGDVEVRKIGR